MLADGGSIPIDMPEAGVLLVPVALGLAISAAGVLAAFDLDVRGGSFGWRQPLGILSSVAVVVGIAPGVAALADGSFEVPNTPLARLLDASLPDASPDGDYNVLLLGDARVLPVPATEYRDGVSWAIIDDGALDVRDRWMPPSNAASALVTTALDEMASTSTLRAGRLLAPLVDPLRRRAGIRRRDLDGQRPAATADGPDRSARGSARPRGAPAAVFRRSRRSRTGRGSRSRRSSTSPAPTRAVRPAPKSWFAPTSPHRSRSSSAPTS